MDKSKRPVFQKPEAGNFFHKLHHEVQQTVLRNDSLRNLGVYKAVLLLAVYFFCYAGILLFGNNSALLLLFYMLTGLAMIIVFINSFHDAVHGSLFQNPKYNNRFTMILELFGGNAWLWRKRHLTLHHAYPNIQHWDIDIKQSDIIRIFPESPLRNCHKYQHIYMWAIYPLYSLNWIYIRDFKDFFGTKDNYIKRITQIPRIEIFRLFTAKLFNLLYLIAIPMLMLEQSWQMIILGWLLMHVSGSVLGVIALISTHVDETSEFPLPPENGKMPTTWAEHQMIVTKDFSTDSRVANFLFGGFTHHVAHHLFPGVAHTYYPHITPIIRRYAKEYGLPYTCHPFHEAVTSHFRMLKNRGTGQTIFATGDL